MIYTIPQNPTKQKILEIAADLFAEKGFTETSLRELAKAVGVKASSIYNYFPSKSSILEYMLEDYSSNNTDIFAERNVSRILSENPSAEGIMECLQLSFPQERMEYYLKVLCVLLQEQLRNPIASSYMSEHVILRAERNTKSIIDTLKELGIFSQNTDHDYWVKVTSSLFYTFSGRMMLGIGDNTPGFTGMGMVDMLRRTFEIMFEKCAVANSGAAESV